MGEPTLVQLRKQETKYDIMCRGMQLKMKTEPCEFGIVIRYVTLVSNPLAALTGQEMVEKTVGSVHVHLKWWEKLLGITLKKKAKRFANKMKNDFICIQENSRIADELLLGEE